MWPDLIKKAKEGGLDAIETYVFWNVHEPQRRQYDFTGNLDIVRFIKTIQQEGLYSVVRIGPYVCAEWNYGGFPVWLHNMPGIEFRTANNVYMNEMQNFTTLIVDMLRKEKLFASQGGPIILAQIENEYGNVMSSYGDAGKAYINWCANMADSLHIGVPWLMCQQTDAPQPMIETCNGFYCDSYTPKNPTSPKMWTENWTGWFKSWGGKDPYRTTEDLAYSVARFFQRGGTFQNYYMYHGGTNFGRTAGGPYITTSYDYNAPLDEYGNLNQPKWGHLKQLHSVLKSMEKTLTYGNISTLDFGSSVAATIYATDEASSCFLGNANETSDATINFQDADYVIPAWSVSILPDCKTVAFNTAKVNTQTSVMIKKPNEANSSILEWMWRPEFTHDTIVRGKGQIVANRIVDQKEMASDASDYLWYMTSVNLGKDDAMWSNNMTLRVHGSGQILHSYVNGKYIGSQWAKYNIFNHVFEKEVKLSPGHNKIVILSATVGLQNYGPMFDLTQAGVPGPVEIVGHKGDETIIKDLSSNKWSYKIGLNGLDNQLFNPDCKRVKWSMDNVPVNRNLTWYKASFKAPLGTDPVVVDLLGLGKGEAWINGHSIGRYWPSFIADEQGCSDAVCDYRGSYNGDKCVSNCGQPTQRYYHVPRSFLNEDVNTIVLFEEFGGNPSQVDFQPVVVGSACATVSEGNTVELSCHGRPISGVRFASLGNPQGVCGAFEKTSCDSDKDVVSIVEDQCVGKESCSFKVSQDVFGSPNCFDAPINRLAVEVSC
ncbi:beta-galactosidase 7 isoform X2 [Carica papaya]|nr:beta-galactosidase 7 isoform X2 [Carica papaya]